jgi:hypothetical protein
MGRGSAQLKCSWFVTEHCSWEESILTPFLQNTGSKNDASQVEIWLGVGRQRWRRIKVRNRHWECLAGWPQMWTLINGIKKLRADRINTKAVTVSDISGRIKRRQLFYGFDLPSIFTHTRAHTHTHKRVHVWMCIHTNYCFPWKHNTINKRNISQRESPTGVAAYGPHSCRHPTPMNNWPGRRQAGVRGPAFA